MLARRELVIIDDAVGESGECFLEDVEKLDNREIQDVFEAKDLSDFSGQVPEVLTRTGG